MQLRLRTERATTKSKRRAHQHGARHSANRGYAPGKSTLIRCVNRLVEPTASLDPKTSREIMRLICKLCAERKLSAIIDIHDVMLAQMFAE